MIIDLDINETSSCSQRLPSGFSIVAQSVLSAIDILSYLQTVITKGCYGVKNDFPINDGTLRLLGVIASALISINQNQRAPISINLSQSASIRIKEHQSVSINTNQNLNREKHFHEKEEPARRVNLNHNSSLLSLLMSLRLDPTSLSTDSMNVRLWNHSFV